MSSAARAGLLSSPHLPAVFCLVAQLLSNSQQLVVLRVAITAAWRAGLDLTAVLGHRNVSDRCILGLARAMADHRGIPVAHRKLDSLESFAQCADLVHLHQDGVGAALVQPSLQELGIGDE